jgi:hypothetical protein
VPEGTEPLCWVLLASEAVDSTEAALRGVRHCACRWRIVGSFLAVAKLRGFASTQHTGRPSWSLVWDGWLRFYERALGRVPSPRHLMGLQVAVHRPRCALPRCMFMAPAQLSEAVLHGKAPPFLCAQRRHSWGSSFMLYGSGHTDSNQRSSNQWPRHVCASENGRCVWSSRRWRHSRYRSYAPEFIA